MYNLIFIAPDGQHVTEGEFNTIEEAQERWANIGSRWIFYPFGAILDTENGYKAIRTDSPLLPVQGLDLWELCDFVADNREMLTAMIS